MKHITFIRSGLENLLPQYTSSNLSSFFQLSPELPSFCNCHNFSTKTMQLPGWQKHACPLTPKHTPQEGCSQSHLLKFLFLGISLCNLCIQRFSSVLLCNTLRPFDLQVRTDHPDSESWNFFKPSIPTELLCQLWESNGARSQWNSFWKIALISWLEDTQDILQMEWLHFAHTLG